jgi:hypothetical protein
MRRALLLAPLLLSALSLACGDDAGGGGGSASGVGVDGDVVGGPCNATSECSEGSECLDEGDFPGGTCTVTCSSDGDCPDGSVCISSEGGVCLLACESKSDCRDGYECEGKSRESGRGDVKVCNG